MKRIRFIAAGLVALTAAVAATVIALAGGASGATLQPAPQISSGVPVASGSLGAAATAMLTRIGASGAIARIGSINGTSFYSVAGADGGHCYVFGSNPAQGLSGGCIPAGVAVPAVIDMSGVVMNPADGSWNRETLQGIAADGIAEVGFVDASGAMHTAPVVGNVYRLTGPFPGGASSLLVGFDGAGKQIFREGLGSP